MKTFLLLLTALTFATARAEVTEEQRRLPIEVDAPDAKLAKIVLLAGTPSNKSGQHEYFAGCALMMNWLKRNPGVWPVLVADGWPKDERVFHGARAVVCYADGGTWLTFNDPAHLARLRGLMEKGVGFVMLHQAVDIPEALAPTFQAWLGGVWTKDIGCRGHWDMEFDPASASAKHPVLAGLQPFAAPLDGWLYNLHFAERGVTPLLTGAVPEKSRTTADAQAHTGRAETVAWAFERADGGRSFAFTGCDLHRNWQVESQRRLVVNGILWAAKLDVPAGGAKVASDPADLAKNLDAKPTPPPAK